MPPSSERIETIEWQSLHAIVCDFDGVLTDNLVYVADNGTEMVQCSRSDGMAFDALRKLRVPTFILSTETNPVVEARGRKLQIPVVQGQRDKRKALRDLANAHDFDLAKVLYVGNDINDEAPMRLCGYRACPADAHMRIVEICNIQLSPPGGRGVIRDLVERVFAISLAELLFSVEAEASLHVERPRAGE